MSNLPTVLEMLQSGVHFGHRVSKQYPKMTPYIFGQKNGVHIINLEITSQKLKEAYEFAKKIASEGGTILFLGTKKQAQEMVRKYAQNCGMPYVNQRWLGGTFTNFETIAKVIKKYNELQQKQQLGQLAKYTKKEQLKFNREIERLQNLVGGIKDLNKIPQAVYIIDLKKEKTAVREANKKNIPIIAICDTNTNPELIQYPIPGNDDAIKSIELITKVISQAITEGKSKIKKAAVGEPHQGRETKKEKESKEKNSKS